jgi:hypothetical protein
MSKPQKDDIRTKFIQKIEVLSWVLIKDNKIVFYRVYLPMFEELASIYNISTWNKEEYETPTGIIVHIDLFV